MPTKMIASSASMAAATNQWSSRIAPLTMENSLTKRPNGGEPVTANSPPKSSAADQGRCFSIPRMSAATDDPVASTRLPTTRKSIPFAIPLFST